MVLRDCVMLLQSHQDPVELLVGIRGDTDSQNRSDLRFKYFPNHPNRLSSSVRIERDKMIAFSTSRNPYFRRFVNHNHQFRSCALTEHNKSKRRTELSIGILYTICWSIGFVGCAHFDPTSPHMTPALLLNASDASFSRRA